MTYLSDILPNTRCFDYNAMKETLLHRTERFLTEPPDLLLMNRFFHGFSKNSPKQIKRSYYISNLRNTISQEQLS